MIAALFVQKDGCYQGLQNIDPWDFERDAKKYDKNYPVIAHPPCQLWGKFAKINYKRWGGEHNKPGNDDGCFAAALNFVNEYGGVLEHPAGSYAWKTYGLLPPCKFGWKKCGPGYCCQVRQSAYGHRADKATWLYYVGKKRPFELIWDRPKGTHQIGFQDQRGKSKNKPTLYKKESNATPLEFRDMLIKLAEYSKEI